MESTRNRLSESQPAHGGIVRDMKRLKEDGAASVSELREFLARMHGKSPQEMLGVVAQSGLAVSMLISAAGCVLLLLAFTLIPYWMSDSASAKDNKSAATKKEKQTPKKSPASGSPEVAGKKSDGGKKPDIAKKLGHKETKTGSPNIDNLIDKNLK